MAQLAPPLGGRGKINLSNLNRFLLVAEWCRLVGRELQVAQVAPPRPQYEKRGEREAARQLGLDLDDVHRAIKVGREDKVAQLAPVSLGGRGNKGQSGGGVGTTGGEGR